MDRISAAAELVRKITEAQQAEKQLEDPNIWADRASLTCALVVILNLFVLAAKLICSWFDIQLDVPPDLVSNTTEIVTFFGVLVGNRIHIASNRDAGK
ncbi:hypothetical protein [Methylovulum miyakonense]|uniref:hypothetical protein n=1 Tax=Methylovulum miyakonense TaxID=645578 RepID=UPI0003687EF4|nr:hypothetical protein [Methylovulum miyakonense]